MEPTASATADNGADVTPSVPPIVAAFLVRFDNRKGYTLAWKRAIDDIQLEDVVEFKCLPSGLHNVDEDLVYFILDEDAGISAFLRKADTDDERNARMLSVGVLVPLESGRVGKSWLHAENLKELAKKQIDKHDDFSLLEKYWDKYRIRQDHDAEESADNKSPDGYRSSRALSTSSISVPARTLTPHHPALALPKLFETFGPLIFPLVRAALLHKRILILGESPVEETCNFVYNISIISSLSRSIAAFVPINDPSKLRLHPLFNVGIADISLLSSLKSSWIACTTDDVLCTKPNLFDLLVLLPNTASQKGGNKTYPKLIASTPELAKTFPREGMLATQRDGRRFQHLRRDLRPLDSSSHPPLSPTSNSDLSDKSSIASTVSTIADKKEAVEPLSWSLMAYTSFVWWASAGDRRSGLMEAEEGENEQDEELVRQDPDEIGEQTKEVALVAYFHRLSTLIFQTMSLAVRRATITAAGERYRDEDGENEVSESEENEEAIGLISKTDEDDIVEVSEEDVQMMGLDVWSDSDKKFIEEMIEFWWGRKATVRGGTVECCGLRVL